MDTVVKERAARRTPTDKFKDRRAELVDAALGTRGELGYARTSIREIAQKSRFTHGVIHYYFSDKVDLIALCVRDYKARCVERYRLLTIDAKTYEELADSFSRSLCEALRIDASLHRLWYDLRSQALYEERFRDDVHAIERSLEAFVWRVVQRAMELRGRTTAITPP